ncbi:DUF1822 family protein [Myxosarcina sp. GI1]|uniref:DUF1822 family protein n=1 Tax=Myxosarcina sp. GI1 TaxID=1541065 RepID=UPI000562A8B4|nr:DUF1822 family protein [Myxosarcina sp. GI1]
MTAIDLFNPAHLVLDFPQSILQSAWTKSQATANSNSRWQSYFDRVVLAVFLPWLRSEAEGIVVETSTNKTTRESIWELVGGTSIVYGDAKLVLIASETEDFSEFRVAREWLDIPEWVADYYLAVQVNVDEGYLRVWGYTTHQKLKQEGIYSHSDRTYSLTETQMIADLDVLWVAREVCPDEPTQAEATVIPEISAAQANNLIQRLGNDDIILPRLAIPFEIWAGLIQNPNWCQSLANKRRGAISSFSVARWLHNEISNLSEEVSKLTELGWRQIQFQPSAIGARDAATASDTALALVKQLTIENRPYELKIMPIVEERGTWRFELRSLTLGGTIPKGFKLRLLTEDMQNFPDNEDVAIEAVELLYLEVSLDSGEGLVWQVEPSPDNERSEILRF